MFLDEWQKFHTHLQEGQEVSHHMSCPLTILITFHFAGTRIAIYSLYSPVCENSGAGQC